MKKHSYLRSLGDLVMFLAIAGGLLLAEQLQSDALALAEIDESHNYLQVAINSRD